MSTHADFATDDILRRYLAHQLLRGRVSLVLGAGISLHFGLPAWGNLIERLFESKGATPPAKHGVEDQAEYFRHTYYENEDDKLIDAIHAALYRDVKVDFLTLRQHATLAGVGALLMASRRGSASEVITLNYDDLLEIYLRYHGFVTESVFQEKHWAGYSDATVYHLHGFVPFDPNAERSENVVLDQQSYAKLAGRENSVWRQLALSIMRRRTCLFIGLSGDDRNLDSILNEVSETHASRRENTKYWGVVFSTDATNDVLRKRWQARNVFFKTVTDYDDDLPKFLFGICQDAAEMLVSDK